MIETMMSRSLRVMFSGSVVLGLGMLSQSVLAQTSSEAQPVQSVVITGSSIPRQDAEAPSPVQVITADELKKSGYTSISQVLENITATGAGTLNQGFTGAFAAGASGIALRGLSVAATLVLIDGHRMAPNALSDDGQRSFVDISNIPFDTIERVEILKDGASAIYGSDAMAGVVNIILKKSFVGTTINAEGGKATEGGGTTTHVSVTHGFGNLSDDGYNAYASLEYRHQDSVSYSQRVGDGGWATQNWAPLGGNNNMPQASQTYLQAVNNSALAVASPGPCSITTLQAGECQTQTTGNLIPETQNVNLLASFTKNLDDGWKLGVKASIFNSKDSIVPLGNGQTFQGIGPMIAAGPYGPGSVTVAPAITVPATYPGNTTGQTAYVFGVIPGSANNSPIAPPSNTTSNTYRLVVDLAGTIGDWDVDGAVGYTKNQINVDYTGMLNVTALQAALNRTVNPFLITGGNSAADLAAIFPSDNSQKDTSTLEFAEFHATRSLMALEGGNLGISTGAEFIYRDTNSPDSPAAQTGSANGSWYAWTVGSQTDAAAYVELAAPVLKTLEIDGALRYDHFNGGVGGATTPKIGFKWTPSTMFALRGTLSTGFRAPNPSENGNGGLVYSDSTVADPLLCPGGVTTTPGAVLKYCSSPFYVREASNPALQPEKSKTGTLGVILEPVKGWGTTFDLYKIEINNQIVPGDISALPTYGPAQQQICTGPTGTGEVPCGPGTGYTGLNTGTPGLYNEPYVNANSTQTSGLELSTSYRFKLGDYGNWTPKLDWSHVMSYVQTIDGVEYQLAGTHGPSSVNADSGNPKDRIQASLTFDQGPWTVTTAFNWVGGYGLTDPTPSGYGAATCAEGQAASLFVWFPGGASPSNYCRVGSFLDTDVTTYYKFSKQLNVHLTLTNIFNRQAPVDLATYGGNGLPYSPTLHEAGVMGRFINAGLTYSF